jgi:hypothetical protein
MAKLHAKLEPQPTRDAAPEGGDFENLRHIKSITRDEIPVN